MYGGSQDDASCGDSDEDESESSLDTQTPLLTFGESVKQETLRAVYQKWRNMNSSTVSADTGQCEPSSTSNPECLSGQHTDSSEHDGAPRKATLVILPFEILLKIFRWAVGSHLDTRVLGRLAQVCRGFYLISCDPSLWRSICFRQWPELASATTDTSLQNELPQRYGYVSWRDMAIRRPHVLLDGCYLCRISYVRTSEVPFTDIYRKLHLVVYYRGIRFYQDGRVCMLTSAYPPNAIVAALGNANAGVGGPDHFHCVAPPFEQEAENSANFSQNGVLKGTYEWCDPEFLVCTLFRPRWRDGNQPPRHRFRRLPEPDIQLTFTIRFRLASSKRRLHSILHWDSYEIHTRNLATQNGHSTTLDVKSDQFPSCHFSPVRSYTAHVAAEPL